MYFFEYVRLCPVYVYLISPTTSNGFRKTAKSLAGIIHRIFVAIELPHLKNICKEYFYTNPYKDYSTKDSGLSREPVSDLFAD